MEEPMPMHGIENYDEVTVQADVHGDVQPAECADANMNVVHDASLQPENHHHAGIDSLRAGGSGSLTQNSAFGTHLLLLKLWHVIHPLLHCY
jgi:hypothetical protein